MPLLKLRYYFIEFLHCLLLIHDPVFPYRFLRHAMQAKSLVSQTLKLISRSYLIKNLLHLLPSCIDRNFEFFIVKVPKFFSTSCGRMRLARKLGRSESPDEETCSCADMIVNFSRDARQCIESNVARALNSNLEIRLQLFQSHVQLAFSPFIEVRRNAYRCNNAVFFAFLLGPSTLLLSNPCIEIASCHAEADDAFRDC